MEKIIVLFTSLQRFENTLYMYLDIVTKYYLIARIVLP